MLRIKQWAKEMRVWHYFSTFRSDIDELFRFDYHKCPGLKVFAQTKDTYVKPILSFIIWSITLDP